MFSRIKGSDTQKYQCKRSVKTELKKVKRFTDILEKYILFLKTKQSLCCNSTGNPNATSPTGEHSPGIIDFQNNANTLETAINMFRSFMSSM